MPLRFFVRCHFVLLAAGIPARQILSMSKLLLVTAIVGLSAHSAAACSLFEGVYKAGIETATYQPDMSVKLWPSNRIYSENDHCILPACLTDSMVTIGSEPVDSFPAPIIDDIANPPQTVTIKGREYRFYCPAHSQPATM